MVPWLAEPAARRWAVAVMKFAQRVGVIAEKRVAGIQDGAAKEAARVGTEYASIARRFRCAPRVLSAATRASA